MYKIYSNKNSLRRRYSRVLQGGSSSLTGNKIGWWERRDITNGDEAEEKFVITNATAGRPDLIAFDRYGTTELEWVILQYNNIIDVGEEFVAGRILALPSIQFIQRAVVTTPVSGFIV